MELGRYVFDGIAFSLWQLAPTDRLDVVAGDRAFLMQGEVAVDEFVFSAPRLLVFGKPQTVEALDEGVYIFKWTHPETQND